MLIAQITDIHLGFQPGDPHELNRKRLDSVIATLSDAGIVPDLILATGDLTEHGTIESYIDVKAVFDSLPCPVWPMVGNHDLRGNFLKVFDQTSTAGGFVQYAFDAGPLRFIVLDTLDETAHGGSFDAERAAWLQATLAEQPGRPTIIALHHPPLESGNGWMNEDPDAAWICLLRDVVVRHPQVVRLISGHLHRAMLTSFAGSVLCVCPPTAPQVALDFRPVDPQRPDGRDMIVAEGPGFALHYWNGRDLVTQFGTGGEYPVLAKFNARMQPEVARIIAERSKTAPEGTEAACS